MSKNAENKEMLSEVFQNPQLEPLENLILTVNKGGLSEKVPALDSYWKDSRYFLHYEIPNIYRPDGTEIIGAKDHWIELIEYIIDDLKWLLSLPHFRFWSNVAYNPTIVDSVSKFLQDAPTFYALDEFPSVKEMRDLLAELHYYVLSLFARLTTNKESPGQYMSVEYHGKLLYDKFIFTIPVLIDLCQLYGRENSKVVKVIIKSVFKLERLYLEDLKKAIPFFLQIIKTVELKMGSHSIYLDDETMPLPERNVNSFEITLPVLEDLILNILDLISSFSIFIEIYTPAVYILCHEDLMSRLVFIYGNTLPAMYDKLDSLAYIDETMPKFMELKHRLDVTRAEFIKLYRTLMYKYIDEMMETRETMTDEEMKDKADSYISFLTIALSEKEFAIDYNKLYPIDLDLNIITQLCPDIDSIKYDFLLQSLQVTVSESVEESLPKTNSEFAAGPSVVQDFPIASTSGSSSENKPMENKKTEIEILSLIHEVKDILCDLGEGFIERCLKHYNFNTESVVNAVLEENLPNELKELDRKLPYIPPDPMEASAAVDEVIGMQRLNIYDNDEFDVMTRDTIDKSRVQKGKRKETQKSMKEFLEDKSYQADTREIYQKYGVVDMYDDEMDDTYDSHDVGFNGRDDTVEMAIMKKPFVTPRVLRTNEKETVESENEDEPEEEVTPVQNGRNNFVQDPAALRARAEERRQSKMGVRGKQSNREVVGNAKGQGQEKEVLANRDKKNKHKTTQGNHNRRAGSQWKRSKGMIPS